MPWNAIVQKCIAVEQREQSKMLDFKTICKSINRGVRPGALFTNMLI